MVPGKGVGDCTAAGKVTVALATRHRLQCFIHGLRERDQHPVYTPHWV